MNKNKFIEAINTSYTFKGESLIIGSAILGDDYDTQSQIKLPLKTLNRHGLIAGATGTGKTKSLQVLTEGLANAGVPVLVMDMKGDLSGLGAAGTLNPIIEKRAQQIGINWQPQAFPLEFLTISDEPGTKLKATVSEYGPLLLGKILELNDSQCGVLSMIFKFCDDHGLALLDLKDLKSVIKYIQEDGKEAFSKEYGFVHSNSAGIILRSIISLEQQDGDKIFCEPSFGIEDLMQINDNNVGIINVLRLTDMQSRTSLFSTFMLCLLAEIFQKMPEQGDADKPKLVIFIDEAHLVFKNASKNLIDQLEMTVKLIRSKGVGLFFVTQSPDDIPSAILGQLGTKIQHSLRAFTANDRKAIKAASENYPISEFYKVNELITEMGIGEALVTTLDEKGRPTELAHTLMTPPRSRMDVLSPAEITRIVKQSELVDKYNQDLDRESAYEILTNRMNAHEIETSTRNLEKESMQKPARSNEKSTFEQILKSPVTNTIVRELARGLLGVLGLKSTTTHARSRRR